MLLIVQMLPARLRTRFRLLIRQCSYRPTQVVEIGKLALTRQGTEVGNPPDTAQPAKALRWPCKAPVFVRYPRRFVPYQGSASASSSMFTSMKNLPLSSNLGRALLVIGWREPVALPDWGIDSIKTKIDTGARTSAIHVDRVQLLPRRRVRFDVIVALPSGDGRAKRVTIETDIVRLSRVRPSDGCQQERLVVATRMRLGPVERTIELSLVSRHGMLCRMLLGRTAIKGGFLIDPQHSTLLKPASANKRSRRAS